MASRKRTVIAALPKPPTFGPLYIGISEGTISPKPFPTISWLKGWAKELGLPVERIQEQTPKYPGPGNYLHEIGHWAVKPDGYNARCKDRPGAVPFSESLWRQELSFAEERTLESQQAERAAGFVDPTPDESGVRAWTVEVILAMGWEVPSRIGCSAPWSIDVFQGLQWQRFWAKELEAMGYGRPLDADSHANLRLCGIDPAKRLFRPNMQDVYYRASDGCMVIEYADREDARPVVDLMGWDKD